MIAKDRQSGRTQLGRPGRPTVIVLLTAFALLSLGASWSLARSVGWLGQHREATTLDHSARGAHGSRSRIGISGGLAVRYRGSMRIHDHGHTSSPPQTMVMSQPPATTSQTTASFSFVSSESGSTFACKLDAASWASCGSPKTYSGLGMGKHNFAVRATDAAGYTDATPANVTWTVQAPTVQQPPPDTTPPDTSITAKPATSTTETTASFSFASSESGSTFTCKL